MTAPGGHGAGGPRTGTGAAATRRSPAAWAVLAAALAFVASPLVVGGFGGFQPQQFPVPQQDPPIVPAGYAFAIWGVVYLWLVIHAASGVIWRAADPAWQPMRWPLAASLAVGAVWIPAAQASPLLATVLIWAMLGTALAAWLRAPAAGRWLASVPVALYAGWLLAASCVSLALVGAGWGVAMGAWGWALCGLLALPAAAIWLQRKRPDLPEFGGAVVWALVAVALANGAARPVIAALAAAGALAVAAVALLGLWRRAARAAD